MEFNLYSDIHSEMLDNLDNFYQEIKLHSKTDIIVLAGDIGYYSDILFQNFIKYCSENYKYVIYVMGNHEYYGRRSIETIKIKMKELFNNYNNVYLLDCASIDITLNEKVYTFYGFTAFTYPIFNSSRIAREYLSDYNEIRTKNGKLTINDMKTICDKDCSNFKNFMLTNNCENLIIITHFALLKDGTSDPIYQELKDDVDLSGYFHWNNMLDDLEIPKDRRNNIRCICSAHTHYSYDFIYDNIRYISKQLGYYFEYLTIKESKITV